MPAFTLCLLAADAVELGDELAAVPDPLEVWPLALDEAFAARWRDCYPAAVCCLLTDRESLTVSLRFPREHWARIRHSNFISVNRPRQPPTRRLPEVPVYGG